ncbi:2-desacetyl-2-hydroxyethyl bacteriochlorophyllide A dehydrogenase [Thermocatellispora tengchongensis]|uniref:2-desacetyl-2-hydroxyethyl bacteriochlorophyllide A dehydrogenase n=1 Tax=Thermocatellispora tengchongensis TaxID=1073253 RepID=A0A840PPZ4_9ACTN|nr:zinc-binding dehydrogenase [Thermocatellispora tengchongensis]MBB5139810.1 2-desacetyl-2-hydroxyethyl bacteriochlorophyllide A dehydrogenase [Thermocatellispora tengchongensis]
MKSLRVTAPGTVELLDIARPAAGPRDVLVKVRACGICGTDVFYTHIGGLPHQRYDIPLGHEAAGEVVEIGADVSGVSVGDHVVVNPMANADGIIGNGGVQGALSELLVLPDAKPGVHFRVIPDDIPWEVAALNEPMAVAFHGVNRSGTGAGTKVVIFGAGPIGLGAAVASKSNGADHVVVVDVVANRLEKARLIGADGVVNSAEEDVIERLKELHGQVPGPVGRPPRPDTDVYLDAAGVPAVIETALKGLKHGAVLTIVGVHNKPVEIDLRDILPSEPDIRLAMGYPTEIFEVTESIIADWRKYRHLISDIVPFAEAERAIRLASVPGATDKVVVVFD